MKISCPQLAFVLELLKIESGNEVSEVATGWSNVKTDFRMKQPLTIGLREKILAKEPNLKFWEYEGSPHDAPDEGFLCPEHKITISFPVKGKC